MTTPGESLGKDVHAAEAPLPPEYYVGPITEYTPEIAAGIGRLMPFLDESFSDEPIAREWLEETIADPQYEQLVAIRNGEVVGAATMSTVRGAGISKRGHLEDFVVHPDVRGQGDAQAVWNAMNSWCRARGYSWFAFETETYRPEAVRFYEKMGAVVVPDTLHLKAVVSADEETGS